MTYKPSVSDHHRAAILQELHLGPNQMGSLFETREELQAAWQEYRVELMAWFARNGRRPAAWWEFECPPGLHFDYDRERSILWEAGIVTGEERTELEAKWRKEFEQADRPDFFTHSNGKVVRGAAARRAHYRWADIPRALVEAWTAERQWQRKTIRDLEAAAASTD